MDVGCRNGIPSGNGPGDKPNKVYVKPINRCNLNCVTCIRHSWDEPFGEREWNNHCPFVQTGPLAVAWHGKRNIDRSIR